MEVEKLLIIDLDGTVWEFNPVHKALMDMKKHHRNCLKGLNFEVERVWVETFFYGSPYASLRAFLENAGYEPTDSCPGINSLIREVKENAKKNMERVKMRSGFRYFLNRAKDDGWSVAYFTNSHSEFVKDLIKKFKIPRKEVWNPEKVARKLGIKIKTYDDIVNTSKPFTSAYNVLIDYYSPSEVVVVGDSLITDGLFGRVGESKQEPVKSIVVFPVFAKESDVDSKLRAEKKNFEIHFNRPLPELFEDTLKLLVRNGEVIVAKRFPRRVWV